MSSANSADIASDLTSTETISIVSEVISYAVGLVMTALLTNHLTSIGYSRVALGIYTLALAYPLLMRGANKTIFSYLGGYFKESAADNALALLSWELKTIVFGSLAFIVLLAITAAALYVFDPVFYHSDYGIVFAFLCLAPLWSCVGVQGNVLLSLKQYRAYFTCNVVSQPVWCTIILGAFIWAYGSLDFSLVMIAYFGSYIITIIGQAMWLKLQPNTVSFSTIWRANISAANLSTWRKYSMELFANAELVRLQNSIGVYLLEFLSADKTAVGLFSVISSIVSLFYLVWTALSTVLTPLISAKIKSTEGKGQLQTILNSINYAQLLLGCAIYAALFFFSRDILKIFGSHYTRAEGLLKVYAAIKLFNMFNSSGITILNYAGSAKTSMSLNACCLILMLTFGSWGAYYYNTPGLMIIAGLSIIAINLVACGLVRHRYGLKVMSVF
jgi:O-antigen/teichoic acid export membrane protein